MSEEAFRWHPGTVPLLVGMPHAGAFLPPEIAARMTPAALAQPDTAWHVEALAGFAAGLGAATLASVASRYVIDLNRSPDGLNRHAGADNTGLCPVDRFDRLPLYRAGEAPGEAEAAERLERWWRPYHRRLRAALDAMRHDFGTATLLDIHTIGASVDRFYDTRSPDIALKSGARRRAAPELVEALEAILRRDGRYTVEVDGRYQGGFIVQTYGDPEAGFNSLQLEISQATYMDEDTRSLRPADAAALTALLSRLAGAVLAWAEGRGGVR